MNTEVIAIEVYCSNYNVDVSFINFLADNGLVEVIKLGEGRFIHEDKLEQLEKLTRLHSELQINYEGVEAINYLLQRIEKMQEEITLLKNKLRVYNAK